jgi:outer membrane biosynthesis protein TonB
MSRLRISGRGIAYAVSGLLHAGVIVALIPSLVGEAAAPTPSDTPMAVDMAAFGDAAMSSPDSVPVESTETTQPVEEAQAQPVDPVQPVNPTVTPMTEPPPPADTAVPEAAEIQPPDEAPVASALEAVTTTAETDAVVAAVPDAVTAEEPELVQPPPKRPDPPRRTERRPPRVQPQRTEPTTETQTAALPPAQPAAPPPSAAASAPSGEVVDYNAALRRLIGGRLNGKIGVTQDTPVRFKVTVGSDGDFSDPSIITSSGDDKIDRDVIQVLGRLSAPTPPADFRAPRQVEFTVLLQLPRRR